MKVLQVNNLYKEGSTGKIVDDIHHVLKNRGYDSVVCYGCGQKWPNLSYSHKITTRLERSIHGRLVKLFGYPRYGGLFIPTFRLIKIIKKEEPDVVHLHCINSNTVNIFILLKFLAKHKIKTVITNHAEFFYTGSCGHAFECLKWTQVPGCGNCPNLVNATDSRFFDFSRHNWILMKDSFDSFTTDLLKVTCVSNWVKQRSIQSPYMKRFHHTVVLNGVNTEIFHYYEDNIFASILENKKSKIVLHSTASFSPDEANSLKGANYLIQLAKKMPDVTFVVAAIRSNVTVQMPSNIILWGPAKSQIQLAQMYSSADCTLLLSKRETFSMPTAETLCCGTPIVGFQAGGPESFAPNEFSEFVEYNNLDALYSALKKQLDKKVDHKAISMASIPLFCKETMANSYIRVYESFMDVERS